MAPVLLLVLACADSAAPSSAEVKHDGSTVADHLVRLDARLDALESAEPSAAELAAERLADLDTRLARVETVLTQAQVAAGSGAPLIGGPVAPSLSSPSTVAALEARLTELEAKLSKGMGEPGSGLFELPKDPPGKAGAGKGAGGKGGGPGGGGAGNGPPGPPPGGGGGPGGAPGGQGGGQGGGRPPG